MRHHAFEQSARAVEEAVERGVGHPMPLFVLHENQEVVAAYPRIVDQHPHKVVGVCILPAFEGVLHGCGVGHIAAHQFGASARPLDFLEHCTGSRFVVHIIDDDWETGCGQTERDGATDAAGTAGDESILHSGVVLEGLNRSPRGDMVVQIYKKRRKCALRNLKIRAPLPPTAEKTHGHRRGEKKKRDAGEKTGKKPAKQGRFRRFLPRFSFFLPFFLSSRWGKRNADGEEREIYHPDSQSISTKNEHFLERERKRSCNFLWKFKTLSVYSRCGCPFAASFSQAQER